MRSNHLLLVPLAAAVAVLVGCSSSNSSAPNTPGQGTATAAKPEASTVSIGGDLYGKVRDEEFKTSRSPDSPIIVPNAIVRMDRKQTVSAEVDGRVLFVGYNLEDKDVAMPIDDKEVYTEKLYNYRASMINKEENDAYSKYYKRLRIGDIVHAGMMLAMIDDTETLVQIKSSNEVIDKSVVGIAEAARGEEFVRQQIKILVDGGDNIASKTEILNAQATLSRYTENKITSERELVKAQGEMARGNVLRRKHYSKAAFTGQIERILVEPGDYVKAGQPLLEILSLDSIRIEGTMPTSEAVKIGKDWMVEVEPTILIPSDDRSGSVGHLKEVTSVVTTLVGDKDGQRAFVMASSLDNTVSVWEPNAAAGKVNQWRLRHPVGVRSLAVSTQGRSSYLASGGEDGRIRLWNIADPERADKPVKEFTDSHSTAVGALAFTPDGRYLISAAGRDIALWETSNGTKLYNLPEEHKDSVTALYFTPQGRLVTASRDKTIRVWKIGNTGAAVENSFDHRKGNVDQLGISSGGGRMLFDKKDGELDIVSLVDGRALGSIRLAVDGARFSALALFSTKDNYILTANSDGKMGGELQIWKTPEPGSRGEEVRRLVTPGRSMPTCAAFGGAANDGFIVVGTVDGGVHLWREAALKAVDKKIEGKIVSLIPEDPYTVSFRVEIVETKDRTMPDIMSKLGIDPKMLNRSSATLIIPPGQKVTPRVTPVPKKGTATVPPLPLPQTIIPVSGTNK